MSEDKRFVMVIVAVLGDRFEEGGVGVRREDELGWSTHDRRLVAGKEGKLAEKEELRLENEVFLGPVPWSLKKKAGDPRRENLAGYAGEFKPHVKDYFFAKAAGHYLMEVSDKSVKVDFYGGDSSKPAKTFVLR